MDLSDLLRHVACALEQLGLRYFVTGSTVTIFYGEARLTNDLDVVVDLPEERVTGFCRQFPEGEFYLSEAAVRHAVRRKGQFNILHPASGLKVDVIVPQATPFNQSRFERVRRVQAGDGFEARFTSPEDAVLMKMSYYRMGGSEKHLRDITGVIKVCAGQLDLAYIADWAGRMGLTEVWATIQEQMDQKT